MPDDPLSPEEREAMEREKARAGAWSAGYEDARDAVPLECQLDKDYPCGWNDGFSAGYLPGRASRLREVEGERDENRGAMDFCAEALADAECSECYGEGIDYEGDEWTLCECVLRRAEPRGTHKPESAERTVEQLREALETLLAELDNAGDEIEGGKPVEIARYRARTALSNAKAAPTSERN